MTTGECRDALEKNAYQSVFQYLYGSNRDAQAARYRAAVDRFAELFGERDITLYSAPGRTEIGGNHTDHQRGRMLAAGVNLDVIAVASQNGGSVITIQSEGHDRDIVDLQNLDPIKGEANSAQALIRGVAAGLKKKGYQIGGFDAYTTSDVLTGSGLSSSAAFEILVGTILSHMYNGGTIDPVEIAKAGQLAENDYFLKPSGLMDQTAAAVGGFVTIDFQDTEKPVVRKVDFDFASCGHALCIIDTKGSHSDLTPDYAAIPEEMRSVARFFGKEFLRDTEEKAFYENIGKIRSSCSDRAVLRAIHFYDDNNRVPKQVKALEENNFQAFKDLIIESGRSSYMYLQNVFSPGHPLEQGVSLALAMCERLLDGKGAWRVHGGGFAGTVQAFVPLDMLDSFRGSIEAVMGEGTCHVLSVRPVGGVKVEPGN